MFASAVADGRLDLPLPGSGRTLERWRGLVELAADDLCVARLAEAHLDALAIPRSWVVSRRHPARAGPCGPLTRRSPHWSLTRPAAAGA